MIESGSADDRTIDPMGANGNVKQNDSGSAAMD
jgi:hypothetical protein